MEKFPKLENGQIALLRADWNTGIILDEQYKYSANDIQKCYTIFDDINEATKYAKLIILERKNIECVIYNNEKSMLFYFTPNNIESL